MMENACSSGGETSTSQSTCSSSPTSSLTAAQKARIERNRLQALLLKNKRLKSAPSKEYVLPVNIIYRICIIYYMRMYHHNILYTYVSS
jgi:hypothetical protein